MVDIRFSNNEYTWANQEIVPAMADAVALTRTVQERALDALRAHRADLGEDTVVRIWVGGTPTGSHGDFWWGTDKYRYEAGLGASLQHYSPVVDAAAAAAFNVPDSWTLRAQMPFGSHEGALAEKTFIADDLRFKTVR